MRFPMSFAAPVLALAAAVSAAPAAAETLYTETFSGTTASNAGFYSGVIAGTGLEILSGPVFIAPAGGTHGNVLDLASGWYAANYGYGTTETGSTTVRSLATFDLLAGYTYSLTFDWSRQTFSAGNGPFDTHLTASFGSHSTTYDDVAGFYYGYDWQPGSVSFVQAATELGAHVVFTAFAPAGYSGMQIDNVSLIGLPPTITAPVPEPETWALMLAGLGALGWVGRRRRSGAGTAAD